MVRDIYVQARNSVQMKGIPRGTYQLAYTAGRDWDGREAIFRVSRIMPSLSRTLRSQKTGIRTAFSTTGLL